MIRSLDQSGCLLRRIPGDNASMWRNVATLADPSSMNLCLMWAPANLDSTPQSKLSR
jgi:hypothetical protein